ncbi:MAG: MoaD/ThiS family protein [Promethearchaeota archaeon]|nr:MAG: MoaD/ThiS family protein [Candidatus Lokiarchaeota archaeon]
MSSIKILFLSLLADITGIDEITLPAENKTTLKDLLEELKTKFGKDFESTIFISEDKLSKYIILSLNGKEIRFSENYETLLQDGDELAFLPAIAGG